MNFEELERRVKKYHERQHPEEVNANEEFAQKMAQRKIRYPRLAVLLLKIESILYSFKRMT